MKGWLMKINCCLMVKNLTEDLRYKRLSTKGECCRHHVNLVAAHNLMRSSQILRHPGLQLSFVNSVGNRHSLSDELDERNDLRRVDVHLSHGVEIHLEV